MNSCGGGVSAKNVNPLRRVFCFLEPFMPAKAMPFKPCPGCPSPAKCKAAGKCKGKTAR